MCIPCNLWELKMKVKDHFQWTAKVTTYTSINGGAKIHSFFIRNKINTHQNCVTNEPEIKDVIFFFFFSYYKNYLLIDTKIPFMFSRSIRKVIDIEIDRTTVKKRGQGGLGKRLRERIKLNRKISFSLSPSVTILA